MLCSAAGLFLVEKPVVVAYLGAFNPFFCPIVRNFCHFLETKIPMGTSGIDHFFIPSIGLELACNGGSCGGISLKREKCHLHMKRLLALVSFAS